MISLSDDKQDESVVGLIRCLDIQILSPYGHTCWWEIK